jgi:3-deoxy-D-manno-octulosonic acid kinase
MQPTEILIDGQHILYDARAVTKITPHWFDPEYWRGRSALTGQASGRGLSYFFSVDGAEYVLRHYRRGGAVARWLGDRYWFRGLQSSRAWREWRLLAGLHAEGLPVPRPLAARVIRQGLMYRADIIVGRLPAAETLAGVLQQRPLPQQGWDELGKLLARFHVAGVYHADLNAHNILLGKTGGAYLIDFDRGCRCRRSRFSLQLWQRCNLRRLRRSLRKLGRQQAGFNFSDSDWKILLAAYRHAVGLKRG